MRDAARERGAQEPPFLPYPQPGEYAPFYEGYIRRVPAGRALELLLRDPSALPASLAGVGEGDAGRRYAPGKWSIKDVVGHVADSERVFAYRALRIARGDRTPLPSFEQDEYVAARRCDEQPLRDLLSELASVRAATNSLLRSLGESHYGLSGTASGSPVSVRALVYIIAGHELHHADILTSRYLAR